MIMKHSSWVTGWVVVLGFGLGGCFKTTDIKFNDRQAAVASGRAPAGDVQDYSLNVQLGKRHYVESVFIQVFSIPPGDPDLATLKTAIFDKREFGGGCDRYGVSEITVNNALTDEFPRARCSFGILPEMPAATNASRYAWTAKACETFIVTRTARFAAVMNKIHTGWTANSNQPRHRPNAENVKLAYDLFFQGETPDTEVVNALIELGNTAPNVDEAWRLILTALCVSPEWQGLI